MEEPKTERLHLGLRPLALLEIDDYRFTARARFHVRESSRSSTIVYLVQLPLKGEFPEGHLEVLKHMRAEQSAQPPETLERLLKKYKSTKERVHVALSPSEFRAIEEYKIAAGHTTRNETLRWLLMLSFEGQFMRAHRSALERMQGKTPYRGSSEKPKLEATPNNLG